MPQKTGSFAAQLIDLSKIASFLSFTVGVSPKCTTKSVNVNLQWFAMNNNLQKNWQRHK